MSTAWWIAVGASTLVGGTTFVLGWWLGRRRQSAQVKFIRRELQATYARSQRERVALRQRYDALLRNTLQAAMDVMRAQRRQS